MIQKRENAETADRLFVLETDDRIGQTTGGPVTVTRITEDNAGRYGLDASAYASADTREDEDEEIEDTRAFRAMEDTYTGRAR